MGQIIAGDWKSYRYLVESIRQFPCQARLDFLSLSHFTLLPEDAYSGSAVLLCVLMAICVSHLSLSAVTRLLDITSSVDGIAKVSMRYVK